jgi:hypothetical protein
LWVINFIVDSKPRFFKKVTRLNAKIESFLEESFEIQKSYKAYEGIINTLNDIRLLVFYKPSFTRITCFRINQGELSLVNSSSFIWSYEINEEYLIRLLDSEKRDNYHQSDINFQVNIREESKNFVIFNKTGRNKYVFVFSLGRNSNSLYNIPYIRLLQSVTARLSRIFDLEASIVKENKKMLKEYRDKYVYVQNAEKAMHFIRNRFNTLDNFIEMSKDNIAGIMDDESLEMYRTELHRLKRNYELLMDRADNILNKPNKPFSAVQLEMKSPNNLFGYVRDIWSDYFKDFTHKLNWNIESIDDHLVQFNSDGLFILLTDWVNNLRKYSEGDEIVIFNEDNTYYRIIFKNRYSESDIKNVKDLKDHFNSSDRDRILKRTSHGIIIMKSILSEMGVLGKIEVDSGFLSLSLSFKKESK